MDRSWVFGKRFSTAYVKGVEEFMKFVSERYPEDAHIRCPCLKCLNHVMRPQPEVEIHIHIHGMSATYTRWIHHGEPADVVVDEGIDLEVQGHDDGIHVDADDDVYDDDHGVPEMIGELYTLSEECWHETTNILEVIFSK
jgi:hypothetical protein